MLRWIVRTGFRVVLLGAVALWGDYHGWKRSVALHGDWILGRDGGTCVALDPASHETAGRWDVAADGRCHLAGMLREWVPPWRGAGVKYP